MKVLTLELKEPLSLHPLVRREIVRAMSWMRVELLATSKPAAELGALKGVRS